ncbi:hypothetical protein KA005_81900 [bacterium]|nr:hypothetical protein [bacterium]
MEIEQSPVFFDHYLASSLGEWFAYYAGFLLPYDVFLNLLTSDQILCSKWDFFMYTPKEDPFLERCPRRKEMDELFKIKKLRFIDMEPVGSSSWRMDTKYETIRTHAKAIKLQRVQRDINFCKNRLLSLTDVDNFLYCSRNKIPLRISGESAPDVLEIAEKCMQEGLLPSVSREDQSKQLNSILRWVFEVEVPALDSRTEKIVDSRIDSYKQLFDTEEHKKYAEEFMRKQFFNERIFINPEELLTVLANKKELRTLQEFLARALSQNLTQAGIRDSIREEWDKLLGRLEISEWAFTGVNILTSPIPFSGAATSVGQVGVNRYLKSRSNWLLTLNKFNKHFRQTMKAN